MADILPILSSSIPPDTVTHAGRAWDAARKLEANFLAEMLKSTGLGEQDNSLSGGHGEDHFASFHRQAIADQMVKSGGIGLSEAFYRAIMEARNDIE